ncbi:sensor histidine kinase [Herbiconiux sp. CPCC 205716]|uniref:histidine kinase n=1 Tax=Herbiconiux gentiana TaxID=2970912 RepID=A0ABT2GM01_9MICO|nr:sensor histidine kinase [Herbiconiux gentiana]MCS5715786.1 sensor histidine kinase [Herbiconiux gentiana]
MSSDPDDWQRPRPGPAGYRRDAVAAGALAVATFLSWLLFSSAVTGREHAPWWGGAIFAVLVAGSLAFRRRWPEAVALVVAVTFVVGQYSGVWEQLFNNICLFIALYTVGAWGRNRTLATALRILISVGMLLWLVGILIFQALNPDTTPDISRDGALSQLAAIGLIQVITNLLYFGGAYVFGNAAWASARQREALEQRTLELEREREVSSRQAVELERSRIARELHDVVAHHVSVMGLSAGAARRVLERGSGGEPVDPRVVQALSVIEENGREAVDELQRMLGALRERGDDPSTTASTRGIAQLGELVDEARAAGLPVSFSTVGAERPVPPAIGLTVYRLAQESLTNVRKHAGPRATADVRLRFLADAIELEVSDTGAGAGAADPARGPDSGGAHLGQIGMRERVAAAGGELELGPKPRGGYRVRARLPLATSAPTPMPDTAAARAPASTAAPSTAAATDPAATEEAS